MLLSDFELKGRYLRGGTYCFFDHLTAQGDDEEAVAVDSLTPFPLHPN